MTPIFTRRGSFELVIVRLGHDPRFVRNARSVGAERVVVADVVNDSLLLANFLAQDVAENAALSVAIPFARRAEFIQDAARHKGSGGELGMRVRPLFSGPRSLILEYGHVFETCIALQVRDTQRIRIENALDFLVG